jgi:hypothetical protein
MMNEVIVRFKSVSDFKRRIAQLWQDQKENEIYTFIFPDQETEDAFNDLSTRFQSYPEGL